MTRGDVPDTENTDSPFVIIITRTAGWPNLRARLVIAFDSPAQADEAAALVRAELVRAALALGPGGPYRDATGESDPHQAEFDFDFSA